MIWSETDVRDFDINGNDLVFVCLDLWYGTGKIACRDSGKPPTDDFMQFPILNK